MIVAKSSSVALFSLPANLSTAEAGRNAAARAALIRSKNPGFFAKSSRRIVSTGVCKWTRTRKARAEIIVFKLHCFAHDAKVSFDAV